MDKDEVLKKAQEKKVMVGEMEKQKIGKANWIANICTCVLGLALLITEGALGHAPAAYAIACIFYFWASVFYFCQYFVAKRHYVGILIGGSLHGAAAITMFVLYILCNVGVL